MSTRHFAGVLAFVLLLSGISAEAQYIFALPGSNGLTSTATVATANPLGPAGSFFANAAASMALQAPVGNKFYVISNSGTNTVIAVDNAFATPRTIANLGQQPTAAILSPDGRKLFVVAGALYGFDTATDTPLFAGAALVPGAMDVAAALDGSRLVVLVNTNIGSTLSAVEPTSGQILGSVNFSNFGTGVSVAPNGLAYVSLQGGVAEVDLRTLTVRTQIAVTGRPGRLVYTGDGRLGLATNLTAFTGAALYGFDLVNRTASISVPLASFGSTISMIDKILPLNSNRALVLSAQTQTLFDVTLSPPVVSVFSQTSAGGVAAAVLSNDVPFVSHPIVQYLYYTSASTLSRFDLNSNTPSGSLSLAAPEGALSYVSGAITGTPAAILTYGDNQSVPASTTSLPLVVRLVDAQGRPLSNIPVTFSTTGGATLATGSTNTSLDGFAVTALNAPTTNGSIAVSANAGGLSTTFTVNVGGTTSGGGGGASAGLTIVSGQGQLLPDNFFTSFNGTSLVVQQRDAQGNPVVNAPIAFTVTGGVGGLFGGSPLVVTTDANGQAKADYQSGLAPVFPGFSTGTVVATDNAGDSAVFYLTTVSSASGAIAVTSQLLQPDFGVTLQGQAGQVLTGAVKAQISATNSGQGIPNVSVILTDPQTGALSKVAACAGTPLSDISGIVSCDVKLGGTVGTFQVTPVVGYSQTQRSFNVTITPGPPSVVQIVQGNNQTGSPGQTLPVALVIQVSDAFNNVLGGVPVTWKAATAGVTISNIVATTNQNGRASVLATLGNVAGQQQVTATVGGVTATFNLTVNIPVTGIQKVSGDAQTAVVGATFGAPLVVRVVNAQGNPVQGVAVTFQVTSGSATVATQAATSGSDGTASTTVQAGPNAGPISVVATSNGFTTTFSLSSRLPGPTNVVFLNGASFQPGIAPGVIATITGTGIAPGVVGLVTPGTIIGPLPTVLAGVSVSFNGTLAPIYSVSNTNGQEQVTVQVPFEAGTGTIPVTINSAGGGNATVNVTLQSLSPGVFQIPGPGSFAVLVRPDGSFVTQDNPIRRGEVIRMYVTGLGQVGPTPTSTNRGGVPNQDVLASIVVGVNNQGIPLIAARTVPGLVGVYEVSFQVPANTATGPSQPLGLIVSDANGNTFTAPGTFAPIQ